MNFGYVPILKWKQGEQRTLRELSHDDRARLLPLIELLPLKVSAGDTATKVLEAELIDLADKLVKAKFDAVPCAIDTSALRPAYPAQAKLLAAVTGALVKKGVNVVPVIYPEMAVAGQVDVAALASVPTVLLRIRLGSVLSAQIPQFVVDLRKALASKKVAIHVVLDMYDIVGGDPVAMSAAVAPYVVAAISSTQVASVTLAGGSFPQSLAGIGQGNKSLPRVEWQTWTAIRSKTEFSAVRFGDYAVTNPVPLVVEDPQNMNPAAQIRYARADDWMLLKAGGSKTGGFAQYNQLCKILIAHGAYSGAGFSFGDQRYDYHAKLGSKTGNYMTWRRDATSHHLVLTVRQVSGLLGL